MRPNSLRRLLTGLVALAGLSMASATARATDINIDFSTLAGVPAATFGAAAGQAGVWNALPGPLGGPVPLVDLTGAASGATLTVAPVRGPFTFANPGPTPPNESALMNDLLDLDIDTTTTVTVTGLTPGLYNVYTYAWAPDSAAFVTGVSVNGLPVQNVGGAWPGGFVQGTTHALHQVTLAAAQNLVWTLTVPTGFGSLNGIQIQGVVPIPEPSTFVLGGIGMGLVTLFLVRRRKQTT